MKSTILQCMAVIILLLPSMACATGDGTPDPSPASGEGSGEVFYIDANHPSADDSNPGTIDSPWLTIGHAAETLQAGDTVYIRDGLYNEHIYIGESGDASGYITFSAYEGETPVIDGTGVEESQNGIVLDQSYIKLIGLEICNWEENGIWVEGAAFLEISDCEVHDVAYGIGLSYGTHDFTLNRVVMHDFDLYGFDVSPGGGEDCYNGVLNDCISHTGRDTDQNVDGFATGHGSQHDISFNRCEAYDVYDGFDMGENGGAEANIALNRCISSDCWNDGYKLTGSATLTNCISVHNSSSNIDVCWGTHAGSVTLRNCTLADAETFGVWVENSEDSLNMFNCILSGGENIGLAFEQEDIGNYVGDYNIFHNDNQERGITVAYEDEFTLSQIDSGAWTSYSGQDANSIVVYADTELFIDPLNFDLHLMSGSTAIDNGTSNGAPSEDYDGNSRPNGGGWDIGAYEF